MTDVHAKYDQIERKVVYSFSFVTSSGKYISESGYISKAAVKEAAHFLGATENQMKEICAKLKAINPTAYRI